MNSCSDSAALVDLLVRFGDEMDAVVDELNVEFTTVDVAMAAFLKMITSGEIVPASTKET